MKKKINILSLNVIIFILAITISLSLPIDISVNAASIVTNIFTEELEEELLEDSNKWIKTKEDSSIDIMNVGNEQLHYTADSTSSKILLQYADLINLTQKQYVEYTVTFEGMIADAVIDFMFTSQNIEKGATLPDSTESVSFYVDPGWIRGSLNSTNADKIGGGWGNNSVPGEVIGLQWTNGNSLLGASNPHNGKYTWKIRYYDNGTAMYFIANPYSDNWFLTACVGYTISTTWAWEKSASAFSPCTSGYPTIMIRNSTEIYIGNVEVGVYDYTDIFNGGDYVNGTIHGDKYIEEISTVENSKLLAKNGEADIKAPNKAILIDNKADDDMLVKRTKLSAPSNTYAPNVYNLNFSLIIPELSGTAKSVLYLGSTKQKDFTDAAALEFSMDGNKIKMTVDTKSTYINVNIGSPFALTINTDGNWDNYILINNEAVKINKDNFVFNKNISDKFIGFGTKGVSEGNKAQIGVLGASFKRYDYKQGTGGDFTETFNNGKYNSANMAFSYMVEDLSQYMYADTANGSLVLDNVGYSGVVSTKQAYGDFEFTFEVSEFMTTTFEDGTVAPCNFLISWGRPSAEVDYAAGGNGLYMVWGNDFNIMSGDKNVKYAEGYNAWCTFSLPTDKLDENGNPKGTSGLLWDYNFTEGNLVFKTVKKDHRVELYVYTADSAEDSITRTKPACVIVNDYTYGCVGICGVPTGKPASMKIDSFSVKNTDEHKAENLIVGTELDIADLDFTPEDDNIIIDPLEEEFKQAEERKKQGNLNPGTDNESGCKSSAVGTAALVLGCVFVILDKKYKLWR